MGRRGLPVVIAVACLRIASLGCGDPEAFRLRGGVMGGAAGQPGMAGAAPGEAGTSAVGGAAGDGLAGAPGVVGLGGQGGAAGADMTGAGGAVAGQGGAGPDGGTDAAVGTAGATGAGGGGAGTTGAAGTAGAAGGRGGAGGGGGNGGSTGGAGAGAAGAGAAGSGAVNYCDRTHWTAKASVTGGDGGGPPAGIDGDLTTRWANNHGQNGTDDYVVDFGGTVKLSKITLDNTMTYPDDYPGAYAVYGSSDGTTFDGTPFVTGSGTTGSTVITFTQRPVRAVRVNQTGNSRPNNWWQIGEFQVVCSL